MSRELTLNLLQQIQQALERVEKRFSKISAYCDFIESEEGREKLDAICMQLIAIGEG